jgi:tetratricopeptide (TPR) repeat protein
MKVLLLPILLLCCLTIARGGDRRDSVYETVIQRGIREVYNLEFENADRDFSTLIALRPRHPAGYFFRAMVTWWRIVIDMDNQEHDNSFYSQLNEVVSICDSMLEVNPDDVDAFFFKGGSIGFEGRLRFHRDDWLAAANAGRKALPLVQQARELDPANYDILLGTGIYNYYAEVIPNEYPFVKPLLLFIPSGDKKKGIEQLQIASEKARYASVETSYFLLQIFYSYEHDYVKALQMARSLHERFPNNMMFHKYLGRCHVVMGDWPAAEAVFKDIADRVHAGMRGYTRSVEREAFYYLGMVEMNKRRFDDALQKWYQCDEISRQVDTQEASGFMVMANLRIGMIYDLQGKRGLAISQYEKVRKMKEYKDSLVQAEKYLQTPYTE